MSKKYNERFNGSVIALSAILIWGCGSDDGNAIDAIDGSTSPGDGDTGATTITNPSDGSSTTDPTDGIDPTGDGVVTIDEDSVSETGIDADDADSTSLCNPPCGSNEVCNDALQCVCAAGFSECPSGCVDLDRDPANCHACGAAAQTEACDGIDNDCNGDTDDGLGEPNAPCEETSSFGTCVGDWICNGDNFTCQVSSPTIEVCDNVDNDCNGATDDGFRDPNTGVYDRDDACGDCATSCIAQYTADDHAHGRCTGGATPACEIVCCTREDQNPNCDGAIYENVNGETGDGCEHRVVVPCQNENDCPQSDRCLNNECVPNPAGGQCDVNEDCSVGDQCVGHVCGCTGDEYEAEVVPPNVLIVLDRSSSMNEATAGSTKWEIAKVAVRSITESYQGQVRFGLMLYPGNDQDGGPPPNGSPPGVVWVAPALTNANAINDFLDDAGTSNGTPTGEAMQSLIDYDGLEDATRNNYIILITDGESSGIDPVPQVAALSDENPPVRTYVIGFGTGVDEDELAGMAAAGDTGQDFYTAEDPAALSFALETVVGSVLSCDYVLDTVPPNAGDLGVYFDQVEQPLDPGHNNGWDYSTSGNRITFYGSSCDALLAGTVEDLVFVYGCPNPIIIGGD